MPGWTNLSKNWKVFFVRLCENGNTEHLRFYEARPALASISFIFTNQTMTCNHLDTNVTIFLMILGRIFLVTMFFSSFSNTKLQQTSRNNDFLDLYAAPCHRSHQAFTKVACF